MSSVKHLFIVVSNYPFGFAEPFLEPELRFLAEKFDRIHIITTEPCQHLNQHFVLPDNAEVVHPDPRVGTFSKLTSIRRLATDPVIRQEIRDIRDLDGSRLTFGKLKTLLVARTRALRLKRSLQELLNHKVRPEDQVFLYSYWCSEFAHTIAELTDENPAYTSFSRAHGWDLYYERSAYDYLPMRKAIFNGLDAIFTISENGRNYLLAKFKEQVNESKFIQSRLGIRKREKKTEIHRRFRRFRIVSCSNLISIKRVDLLIRSLERIDDLEIEWVHFGDGVLMSELRMLAEKQLGPKKNISFKLKGRVPNWELLNYYGENEIDLFITVSKWDGIPVSIMEAMSFGIPTVGTNVGGIAEIVLNGQNGILLNRDPKPDEVASALKEVANMPDDQYNLLRSKAQETWGTFYSAEINYPIFCERIFRLSDSKRKIHQMDFDEKSPLRKVGS